MLMALIANVNRDTKRKRSPYRLSDFLPVWGRRERPAWEKVKAKVMVMHQLLGGSFEDNGDGPESEPAAGRPETRRR